MRKPQVRAELPAVTDSGKRLPSDNLDPQFLEDLARRVRFMGWEKHKREPLRFNLPLFTGRRADYTMCDVHADFTPEDVPKVQSWMKRGILAGMVGGEIVDGDPRVVWALSDNGWLFEAINTVSGQSIYHGYPVREEAPVAQILVGLFERWTAKYPSAANEAILALTKARYSA